jgi:myosin-crossreactive antigen
MLSLEISRSVLRASHAIKSTSDTYQIRTTTFTLKAPSFFNAMIAFRANDPGTGGLVTFKDSHWLMSVFFAHQPHFIGQPKNVLVFWEYSLFPDCIGNFVAKPMDACNSAYGIGESPDDQ